MRLLPLALAAALTLPWAMPLAAGTVPIAATAPVSEGVELLMVNRIGCAYCAAWMAEVMPHYADTPEGRAAPLRIVEIDGPWPDGVALARRPFVTPTFILLRAGREAARLEGYPGARHFLPVLAEMLQKAGVPLTPGT